MLKIKVKQKTKGFFKRERYLVYEVVEVTTGVKYLPCPDLQSADEVFYDMVNVIGVFDTLDKAKEFKSQIEDLEK